MDKTRPFSFVDDKVFCGNSLLGLTSLEQLRYLHVDPKPSKMQQQLLIDVDAKIAAATHLRHELASPVDEHDVMRSTRAKVRLLEQFRQAIADLHLIADGVIAAGLPLGAKAGRQLDAAFKTLSWQLQEALPADGSVGDRAAVTEQISSGLRPIVDTDHERWKPLHWVLEAPDVIVEHGGFDAVIGNPPFMSGRAITPSQGANVRSWLVNVVAAGSQGSADLCVYFVLRACDLLGVSGQLGLIATNTIAQGDSRSVGLDRLLSSGVSIRRAIRSMRWPTRSASLEIALVWLSRAALAPDVLVSVDGEQVARISSLLEPVGRVSATPRRLAENAGLALIGSNVNGTGFTMSPEEARHLLGEPDNAKVLFPYLGGADLNSGMGDAPRWIVNFFDWSEERARQFAGPFEWIQERVKPYRATLANKPHLQERWWIYEARAVGLYERLSTVDTCLAMAIVSRTCMPVRVSARQVFSHKVVVFGMEGDASLAVLSSSVHSSWAWRYSSTMKSDLNYSPTDVFATFPRPAPTSRLEEVGRRLDEVRREIMLRRGLGLTALYNMINEPSVTDDRDVEVMREIHVDVDQATVAAFGWDDLELGHGFHTYRQMERWTVAPAARAELLDRLLEENLRRARAEGQDVPEATSPDGQDTLFA